MTPEKLEKLKSIHYMNINIGDLINTKEIICNEKSSTCEKCCSIAGWILNTVCKCSYCWIAEAAIAGVFTTAEIVFPEAEEILIPLEVVFEGTFVSYCNKHDIKWIKDNIDKIAKEMCEKAKLCS